ncbi:hypothetical protein LP419_09705 [Massilia sp. H-1]|nr:hypothetical protein LP419_09705 [Massilia sp. H-1]
MLIEAAARQWNVPLNACRTERGVVIRSDGARLRYAELAAAAATLAVPDEPLLKDPSQFTLIGKALMGVDTPAIVRGEARYGIDARAPGMLVAVIALPPVRRRAQVGRRHGRAQGAGRAGRGAHGRGRQADPDAGLGVAVVATNTWAAMQGRKALLLEWRAPDGEPESDARLHAAFTEAIHAHAAPCCAATATWAPPWRPARPCTKPCSKRPSWPTPRWNR